MSQFVPCFSTRRWIDGQGMLFFLYSLIECGARLSVQARGPRPLRFCIQFLEMALKMCVMFFWPIEKAMHVDPFEFPDGLNAILY